MAKRSNCVNLLAPLASLDQCKPMAKQDKSREERLAKALRDNLLRRKAQSREIERDITSDGAESPSRR
jgi:hypothetical protein